MITGSGSPVIYAKKSIRNQISTRSSSIPGHGHVPALIDVCLLFVSCACIDSISQLRGPGRPRKILSQLFFSAPDRSGSTRSGDSIPVSGTGLQHGKSLSGRPAVTSEPSSGPRSGALRFRVRRLRLNRRSGPDFSHATAWGRGEKARERAYRRPEIFGLARIARIPSYSH